MLRRFLVLITIFVSLLTAQTSIAGVLHCLPSALGIISPHNLSLKSLDPFQSSQYDNYREYDEAHGVPYLHGAEERAPFEMHIKNGILYDANNEIIHGERIYVMDKDGKYYQASEKTGEGFHHSSFMAGFPIASAGGLITDKNGFLKHIDNGSGHYRPSSIHLMQALDQLSRQGVSLKNTTISFGGDKSVKWSAKRKNLFRAESFLYSNPESKVCIEDHLLLGKEVEAHDFVILNDLDENAAEQVIAKIESKNRLHQYESVLKDAFRERPTLRKLLSNNAKKVIPSPPLGCYFQSFLKRTIQPIK